MVQDSKYKKDHMKTTSKSKNSPVHSYQKVSLKNSEGDIKLHCRTCQMYKIRESEVGKCVCNLDSYIVICI